MTKLIIQRNKKRIEIRTKESEVFWTNKESDRVALSARHCSTYLHLGGRVIGSEKIFCLKLADDLAIVADTENGIRDIIKELEKYTQNNKLSINCTKKQNYVL